MKNQPEWSHASSSLKAEFHIQIKEWASSSGHRQLCPIGVFSGAERSIFRSAGRQHDIYFPFPSETRDHIILSIPGNYRVEAVPQEKYKDLAFLSYKEGVERSGDTLEISRRLTVNRTLLSLVVYAGVHALYQDLQATDDSQMVFSVADAAKP